MKALRDRTGWPFDATLLGVFAMVSIKRLAWLHAAALVLPLAILPAGAARAQYFLNMTERSGNQLQVSMSLGGFDLNDTLVDPHPNGDAANWAIGPESYSNFYFSGGNYQGNVPGSVAIGEVAWLEPGNSLADPNPAFDVLIIADQHGSGLVLLSDVHSMAQPFGADGPTFACFVNGVPHAVTCPIYNPGQTAVIPLFGQDAPEQPYHDLGNFTVSFNDLGDSAAVLEPAVWALMLVGFGGLGAMLRRRRTLAGQSA